MRARLFWKLGLAYLGLLLAAFLVISFYSSQAIRRQQIQSSYDQLDSLLTLARARPPRFDDASDLRGWTRWIAQSGVRVTVMDPSGRVLAESDEQLRSAEDRSDQPEIGQAFSFGEGQSVRRGANRDIAYRAIRYQRPSGTPVVIRVAMPLVQADASLADLRRGILMVSLIVALLGAAALFAFSRFFAVRVDRLRRFALRLAARDFRLLPAEGPEDELADLAKALNQTAGWMDRTIQSLSGERDRSSAILRSMAEGVAVIDAEERLVFSNRAFSEILNLDSGGSEGRPLIEVLRNSELLGLIRRALRGEEGLRSEIAMGIVQQRNFSVTAAPVISLETGPPGLSPGAQTNPSVAFPAAGKPSGAVVVLHDVTELRRLERVRQDFVVNVSHEFKTPLTAIQGFAETLLAGAVDDPQNNRRFLGIIREHAARLARLTNDLLKLARIEAGKLEVQLLPVNVEDLIEGCAETALLKASQKQIALEIDVPPGLPPLRGDPGLLRDVLQNLIDNAIQYTPSGGRIHLSACPKERDIVIVVSDTGIGIPLVDQERIFERFYRVDAARSREAGGTGLGLSIVKHVVEVHGGRLWVESEVGLGSKFSFSIPRAG